MIENKEIDTYRKINIRFKNNDDLLKFSKKILGNSEQVLTKNLREVHYTKYGIDLSYKRNIKLQSIVEKEWEQNWKDLTPFEMNDFDIYTEILFYFDKTNEELSELLEQKVTSKTRTIYFPEKIKCSDTIKRIIGIRGNPQYPIYIISKGRSNTCVTADHLIKMDVPFNIVIESQEFDDYAKIYGPERLIILDMSFKKDYDPYIENFDENKSKGSGPARNFVWWHAKNVKKSKWHWIMDDNIFGFHYFNDNQRIKAVDGTIFSAAEDFVNRYDNIGISGLNYFMFAVPGVKDKPYVANTKIYSCLLIRNEINIRWAGRYNEDVDLCIRALKEGYSTIQFDAFLARKGPTQMMSGGNTDAFYAEEGTLPKSNMLAHNHPDITEVMWRFSRWHHITNYNIFDYYKDRTIGATIEELMKPQILDLNNQDDLKIISEIKNIDFSKIKRWNILENIEYTKRFEIVNKLKFYRYKKDNDEIINILTRPKILNCDYYDYIWGSEIEETEDNKIMKDLINLGLEEKHNGVIKYSIDFDKYLSYVKKEKRDLIIKELIRNKYLLNKNYEKFEYGIQEFILENFDHINHNDSKNYILNKFVNKNNNLSVPITFYDERMRGEIKLEKKKSFKNKLTLRSDQIIKENSSDYTLMIHGSEDFCNEKLFNETINNIIDFDKYHEIINSVNYKIDLLSANLALDKKLKNKEFVPDIILYNKNAYKKIYENMSEYADECILFLECALTEDLIFLISEFENKNKKVTIIRNKDDSNLTDW